METEDLRELLEKTAAEPNKAPGDSPPDTAIPDVNIDDEELGRYLVALLKNYICDKEDMGWDEKRQYDLRAYYGIKDDWLSQYPWPNASNYPVPITPVLLETGWAAINDILYRDPDRVSIVKGVGPEDIKNAKKLEAVLNWQILNDIPDMKRETFANTFQMLLHGTSYQKIIKAASPQKKFQLAVETIPIERIYISIDAKSPLIGSAEAVIQIIPLSANDLRQRMAWGVYQNLDKVAKGWNVGSSNTPEKLAQIKQQITGLDVTKKITRDTWFIAEAYLTYYPKNSLKAKELIVWFAPSTGAILRKIENDDGIRPFSDWYCYPNPGLAFHRSLPEMIRNVQEKATYTDKQVTDAADKSISPAGFYDAASGFDPNMSLRVPTGMYPMKNVQSIQWEQINLAPLLERKSEIQNLWLEAERITGFTDTWQGINSGASKTLGQDVLRTKRADLRFGNIVGYVNDSWKRTNNLIKMYDDKYMPRDIKVKVMGATEFESIDKLFKREEGQPEGDGLNLNGQYDFSIANKTIDQQELEDRQKSEFAGMLLSDPKATQDLGNWYRTWQAKAEAMNIRDLGEIIKKPKEADIMTPDEVINRLMDGEKNLQPSIYANPVDYEERLRIYMRSGNYREAAPEIQAEFQRYLMTVIAIRIGREQAMQAFQMQQAQAQAQSQALTQSLGIPAPKPAAPVANGAAPQ